MAPWRVPGLVLAHWCAEQGPRAAGYVFRDLEVRVGRLWVGLFPNMTGSGVQGVLKPGHRWGWVQSLWLQCLGVLELVSTHW